MRHILLLTTVCLAACAGRGSDPMPEVGLPLPKLNVQPRLFKSCAEITTWQAETAAAQEREFQRFWDWASRQPNGATGVPVPVAATPGGGASSGTNIQEPGVDEPDFSKVSGANLIVARDQRVEIVRLPELRLQQTLALPGLREIKVFAPEGRLVVMGKTADEDSSIRIYRLAENGYVLAAQHKARGIYADARLNGDRLLVLTRIASGSWQQDPAGTLMGVDCTRIQKPVIDIVTPPVSGCIRFRSRNRPSWSMPCTSAPLKASMFRPTTSTSWAIATRGSFGIRALKATNSTTAKSL